MSNEIFLVDKSLNKKLSKRLRENKSFFLSEDIKSQSN